VFSTIVPPIGINVVGVKTITIISAVESAWVELTMTEVNVAFVGSVICGNEPLAVTSRSVGTVLSLVVAAARLVDAACAAVEVVNFVTVKVMTVFAENVPAVSFTVSTEPLNATLHTGPPEEGAVTAQTLGLPLVSKAMPEPANVMTIPAFVAAVMAVDGVKEIVAVVAWPFWAKVRVMAGPVVMPP